MKGGAKEPNRGSPTLYRVAKDQDAYSYHSQSPIYKLSQVRSKIDRDRDRDRDRYKNLGGSVGMQGTLPIRSEPGKRPIILPF